MDRTLLQRLHERHLIDERNVLWWQLGFEGRRIFSEEEFAAGLKRERWLIERDRGFQPYEHPHEEEFTFWKGNDVPIVLRTAHLDGFDVPSFVTVKPLSHRPRGNDFSRNLCVPPSVYGEPHFRGAVIELTERHLFWYPLEPLKETNAYRSYGRYLNAEQMWYILHPISSGRFYRNLIERSWSGGRRAQTRAKEFYCAREGYVRVPYYAFSCAEQHVTVYPAPIFPGRLDIPVFFKSIPRSPGVEVIGAGYTDYPSPSDTVRYWPLDRSQQRVVRRTLEKALS